MNRKYTPEVHVHHGITHLTYDNDGAVRCAWHLCTYNVYDSFDEPEIEVDRIEEVDLSGYQCTDARLGNYICCGQKINPESVCWELDRADERLVQANRDGIEDSWYEESDE